MLKRAAAVLFLISLVISFVTISWAGDPSTQMYNWTGFYAGLNGGWAHGSSDAKTSTVFSPTGYFATTSVPAIASQGAQDLSSSTFTGGVQAGYNWQTGPFVVGGEMDFNYMHLSDRASSTAVYPCCAPTTFTVESSMHTNWLFTARPKVGYAFNNWLLYGTGGLAVTKLNANFNFTDTFATAHESESISKTKAGWTVGGGVEMGIAKNCSLKAEYLYADFGSVTSTDRSFTAFAPPISFPTNEFKHTIDLTTHIVRLGLNYRF
jgi:outer membrane immunogenic protein